MSQTDAFIQRLESLKEGERARLRGLAGQPLDVTLAGFDLFTGLWWPLRQKSPVAPRRETSWLITKLFGAFSIPHTRRETPANRSHLARVLGKREPRHERDGPRYRTRFDALLCSPLSTLEIHLRWALSVVADAAKRKIVPGLDWAQLLDDLSIWDRADEHDRQRDIRDIWAEEYLNAV